MTTLKIDLDQSALVVIVAISQTHQIASNVGFKLAVEDFLVLRDYFLLISFAGEQRTVGCAVDSGLAKTGLTAVSVIISSSKADFDLVSAEIACQLIHLHDFATITITVTVATENAASSTNFFMDLVHHYLLKIGCFDCCSSMIFEKIKNINILKKINLKSAKEGKLKFVVKMKKARKVEIFKIKTILLKFYANSFCHHTYDLNY